MKIVIAFVLLGLVLLGCASKPTQSDNKSCADAMVDCASKKK